MCSGSEADSSLRHIDFVYHSTNSRLESNKEEEEEEVVEQNHHVLAVRAAHSLLFGRNCMNRAKL